MSTNESIQIILGSFNKAINDAIFSTIYDCKGVGIGTIDILKDKVNSDNISKLQFAQELFLLQQCGLSNGFNDELFNNLYNTLYEQILLLNKSNKIQLKTVKQKNIGVIIKYQLKNVIYYNDFSQLISQTVYQIIDIIRQSNRKLDESLITSASNMIYQTFDTFTNKIEIINSIRRELTISPKNKKEGFISILKGNKCKNLYIILLFIFFVLIVSCFNNPTNSNI